MTQKFRLSSVLRARRAAEDVAKGAVLQARAAVHEADEEIARREQALDESSAPEGGNAWAVAASLAARQSLAASLAAARQVRQSSEELAARRTDELADAAKARWTVEKLAERHEAMVREQELNAEQRVVDELSMTAHQRRGATGVTA
ncbi:hypothetical protein GCM10009682_49780 [Luedemannella flava]|uniref:Flagellar FliJ protein n=1 Tax=Luedemannella flava TaxID=349316 RepID=A0ABP4YM38_9ACTN